MSDVKYVSVNITELADILGVSKSYLYQLKREYPNEVPRHKDDTLAWGEFINRHRIEPTGALRLPPLTRISR